MEEQSAATKEVTSNLVEVTKAVAESGRSANDVLSAASGLAKNSTELETQVQNFLANFDLDSTKNFHPREYVRRRCQTGIAEFMDGLRWRH